LDDPTIGYHYIKLAAAPGFEPGNGGIKIRCLTTWLRRKACRNILAEAWQINRWTVANRIALHNEGAKAYKRRIERCEGSAEPYDDFASHPSGRP
jgi:hypothetical protein